MSQQLPNGHVEVDWSKWSLAEDGDVRSPCPALNCLANHNILPHNGKDITKAMAVEALTKSFHLDTSIAGILSTGAVAANPDRTKHTFDLNHLDKHGYIEHDVSLSRNDIAFGSNSKFDKTLFDEVLEGYRSQCGEETSWSAASHVRYARVKESKARHEKEGKEWRFGLKETIISYGETSFYLNLLGKDGVAPLAWIKAFFEEERLPHNEGWRPPPKIDQSMLNHGYLELIKANPHRLEEALLVGMGTLEAVKMTMVGSVSGLFGGSTTQTHLGDIEHLELVDLKAGQDIPGGDDRSALPSTK